MSWWWLGSWEEIMTPDELAQGHFTDTKIRAMLMKEIARDLND